MHDGLSILVRTYDRPMGLALNGRGLALGTRQQIWEFRDAPDIAPQLQPPGLHDACFLPRLSYVTGDIGVHEMAWLKDELWVVNTRFSCLCTVASDYSFVPRWRPPFISTLAAENRCHLNGLCVVGDQARFVTALGTTNVRDGWRANKGNGGVGLDVTTNAVVMSGLCMPHSPRWYDEQLWVLESGTGRVLQVYANGRADCITEVPGFVRGFTRLGRFAFVGLSKIRPTSAMAGVPLAERRNELKCGIALIDLERGHIDGFLDFQTGVEEIFDAQVIPSIRFPELMGFQKDEVNHTFVVPPTAFA
jgi:uncharacterized protein (TIGR03032 family)